MQRLATFSWAAMQTRFCGQNYTKLALNTLASKQFVGINPILAQNMTFSETDDTTLLGLQPSFTVD